MAASWLATALRAWDEMSGLARSRPSGTPIILTALGNASNDRCSAAGALAGRARPGAGAGKNDNLEGVTSVRKSASVPRARLSPSALARPAGLRTRQLKAAGTAQLEGASGKPGAVQRAPVTVRNGLCASARKAYSKGEAPDPGSCSRKFARRIIWGRFFFFPLVHGTVPEGRTSHKKVRPEGRPFPGRDLLSVTDYPRTPLDLLTEESAWASSHG